MSSAALQECGMSKGFTVLYASGGTDIVLLLVGAHRDDSSCVDVSG